MLHSFFSQKQKLSKKETRFVTKPHSIMGHLVPFLETFYSRTEKSINPHMDPWSNYEEL